MTTEILVVGARGRVGREVVRALSTTGARVRIAASPAEHARVESLLRRAPRSYEAYVAERAGMLR